MALVTNGNINATYQTVFIMSKHTSLLSKTLKQFAICATICLVLTAPLFYLLTKYYYAEDIIEAVNDGKNIPPLDLEQDIMTGMMIQYMLIFCVITLAMFITMRFITKNIWKPFDDTLRKTEGFNLAQDSIPLFADTDIKEFNRLNISLQRLMSKDKETYRIQKEFTENASHELQTPLSIIRSKLDLLMQEELGEKEMQLVSDLYRLTMRMGHLNRNLLLLAKIENAQYTTLQEVDITEMLNDTLEQYEALQNTTTLKLTDETPHQKVKANQVLFECLLKNLIVNAIRHSPSNGIIQIAIRHQQFTISNKPIEGQEGRPLNATSLFQRFHSENDAQKGNGLGLAIVKAICDFHHWTIEYTFNNGKHQFDVHFPSY